MLKDKLIKILKTKVFACVVTGAVLFSVGVMIGSSEVDVLQSKLEKEQELGASLSNDNKKLQAKVDEAKPWFEMKKEEQEAKVAQVKKEEEERKVKEQAEKEAAEKAKKEKEEADKKAEDERLAKEKAAKEAEEKKGYDTGITYDQLARTPNDYIGKKIKFSGKVIQVMEGKDETQIRLSVNDNHKTVLYCGIPKKLTENNRILENDKITVMGLSTGLITYKSTMGGDISIPGILVDKFE